MSSRTALARSKEQSKPPKVMRKVNDDTASKSSKRGRVRSFLKRLGGGRLKKDRDSSPVVATSIEEEIASNLPGLEFGGNPLLSRDGEAIDIPNPIPITSFGIKPASTPDKVATSLDVAPVANREQLAPGQDFQRYAPALEELQRQINALAVERKAVAAERVELRQRTDRVRMREYDVECAEKELAKRGVDLQVFRTGDNALDFQAQGDATQQEDDEEGLDSDSDVDSAGGTSFNFDEALGAP